MNFEKVDCQVNYGTSLFGPDCDIDVYNKIASSKNITDALVIPTPSHKLRVGERIEKSCIWEHNNNSVSYRRELIHKDRKK